MILAALLMLGLCCDEKPESLRLMEQARRSIVFADVIFSEVMPNATAFNVREPWYGRNFIARDEVAHISVGTKSGITAFSGDGKPKRRGPTGLLKDADGTYWMHDMDTTSVQRYTGNPTFLGVHDFRTWGMSFRSSSGGGPAGIVDSALPDGPVTFTETDTDGLRRVEASAGERSVVWFIDPELNWNPTQCELWVEGKLVRQSRTEYEEINGVFVPIACAFLNNQGDIYRLMTVESASINDDELPTDLTPEYIGVEPGMTVHTSGERPQKYIGDGKSGPALKVFAMRNRGELEFGPKVKAAYAGQPIDWFIPDPKQLKKQMEAFRRQIRGPLDEWQKYTLDFIAKHGLDDGQTQRALHILRSCQLQRDHYLRVKKPQIEKWKEQIKTAGEEKKKRLATRIEKSRQVVTEIFEAQLKPRLANLLTRSQRRGSSASETSKKP